MLRSLNVFVEPKTFKFLSMLMYCPHPHEPNILPESLFYGFHDESACNIMVMSDLSRGILVLTP